jgi:hypothetical protein
VSVTSSTPPCERSYKKDRHFRGPAHVTALRNHYFVQVSLTIFTSVTFKSP